MPRINILILIVSLLIIVMSVIYSLLARADGYAQYNTITRHDLKDQMILQAFVASELESNIVNAPPISIDETVFGQSSSCIQFSKHWWEHQKNLK